MTKGAILLGVIWMTEGKAHNPSSPRMGGCWCGDRGDEMLLGVGVMTEGGASIYLLLEDLNFGVSLDMVFS